MRPRLTRAVEQVTVGASGAESIKPGGDGNRQDCRGPHEPVTESTATRSTAPDFPADRVWFNVARPLSLKSDLRGKLVLLHFWSASSVASVHRQQDLERIAGMLGSRGCVVVGCHAARFKRENELDHVRGAVLELGIENPVVADKNLEIWQRYRVRAWGETVVVAPDGTIAGRVGGEAAAGAVRELALSTMDRHAGSLDARPLDLRLERDLEPAADLAFPERVLATAERLFISDAGHHRIVVTARDGRFLDAFGSGRAGHADGDASTAEFRRPHGLVLAGNVVLVADTGNHAIRAIDLIERRVTTVAGTGARASGPLAGGPALETALSAPTDLAVHSGGQVLITMSGAHQLWRLDRAAGRIEPFAGTGAALRLDGDFADSAFAEPTGIALERNHLCIADSESCSIRRLDLVEDHVGTIAGGGPDPRDLFHTGDEDGKGFGRRFQRPIGLAARAGVVYVADSFNHRLRAVDTVSGRVTTAAGTGAPGHQDGPAEEATFREPHGVAATEECLYVADTGNHRIRVVDVEGQTVSTLRLSGVPIPPCVLRAPRSVAYSGQFPDLAAQVTHAALRANVLPGTVLVRIAITLPRGATLVDGPSRISARRIHGAIDADFAAEPCNRIDPAIPIGVDGPGEFEVAALYYWGAPDGRVFLRAARWPVEVRVDVAGADSIALADALD